MNKNISIILIVIVSALCVILSAASVVAAFYLFRNPESLISDKKTSTPFPTTTISTEDLETENDVPDITTNIPIESQLETGNNGIDAPTNIPFEIQAEMELIQHQVIEERGLEVSGVFTRVLYTKDQLNQRLIEDFKEDYDPKEEKESAIVLEVFGLLNADFDLYNFYLDLFTEQIAGFYDNETKEMVVILGEGFKGPERLTYAHEYTHALQDQNYDIRDGLQYNEDSCETDTERCAAIQALMEGDASLSELTWFQRFATIEDQTEILRFYQNLESPMLDSAPPFIAEDLLFPYDAGYTFVNYLYQHGGWDAVDLAYATPPVTTEQILHPEKYPDDQPIPVLIPNMLPVLGEGWLEIDCNVMGEWYTYLILAHGLGEKYRLNDQLAKDAAEGWGGDTYTIYYNQDQSSTVMIFKTIWESSREADEFVDAFLDYAQGRFGKPVENTSDLIAWSTGDEVHVLRFDGVNTTWIAAPDLNIATLILDTIQDE